MLHAKFNGYKRDKEGNGLFFVGKIYKFIVVDSGVNYQTTDENGNIVKFRNFHFNMNYDFSIVNIDGVNLNLPNDTRDDKMKYRMNGIDVTKSFFYDKLLEVEELKSSGVTVLIDFEVSFE